MWAYMAFSGDVLSLRWEADFPLSGTVEKLVFESLSVLRDSFELFFKAHVNNMIIVVYNPVI